MHAESWMQTRVASTAPQDLLAQQQALQNVHLCCCQQQQHQQQRKHACRAGVLLPDDAPVLCEHPFKS